MSVAFILTTYFISFHFPFSFCCCVVINSICKCFVYFLYLIKLLLELGNKALVKIKLTKLCPFLGAVLPAAIGPIVGLDDALICKIK